MQEETTQKTIALAIKTSSVRWKDKSSYHRDGKKDE